MAPEPVEFIESYFANDWNKAAEIEIKADGLHIYVALENEKYLTATTVRCESENEKEQLIEFLERKIREYGLKRKAKGEGARG